MSSIYLLTFRARIESGDTLRALDAVTSQSRYGDWSMDESAWFKPPLRVRKWLKLPLASYDVEERLNIQLAIPLLKLAEWLPRLGNIQTVWLLNIIVASLTVGLLYLCLRAMSYNDAVSIAVALGAGISSNLWAYSQTMFREPLVGFFLLLAVYLIQISIRRSILVRVAGIAAGLVALYLATETKYSALAALPALAVFALPSHRRLESEVMRRLSYAALAVQVLLLLALMFVQPVSQLIHSFYPDLDPADSYFSYALRIFLLSPGGSIWATSPLVLFSAVGSVVLLRQGKHRLVWTVWLLTIGYSLGHATAHWRALVWWLELAAPLSGTHSASSDARVRPDHADRRKSPQQIAQATCRRRDLLRHLDPVQRGVFEPGALYRNPAAGIPGCFGVGTRPDTTSILSLGASAGTLGGLRH